MDHLVIRLANQAPMCLIHMRIKGKVGTMKDFVRGGYTVSSCPSIRACVRASVHNVLFF